MTLTLSLIIAGGLAIHVWRMDTLVNNPGRYERVLRFERQLARFEDAARRRMAAEGKRAIGWLIRKATKRK
ncbi:MAG: hypothetical protein IRY99_06000 [Isosphaeraceae bacterium]|nr:hypothetical protein [Isosphaeraceae bacterium]